jgi:anaerobic dimethyl sulfoxide reductase subunit C (anchor subunit)
MAIGAFGTIFMIYWVLSDKQVAGQITFIPLLAVGAAISVALLGSLFHLGTPKNPWRSLNHLRKSWLSREILFTSGFAGLWAILMGMRLFQIGTFSGWTNLAALAAFCGLVAVYCMQSVYQLRSVPAWNTGRTLLEFTISTVGLGCLLTGTLLPRDAPAGLLVWIALAGLLGAVALSIWPAIAGKGSMFLVLIIALAEEAIGRWLFYSRRNPGI